MRSVFGIVGRSQCSRLAAKAEGVEDIRGI
jgi:hypothetical protein